MSHVAQPMTPAQRVDYLRSQLRYRLQDAHDIWTDVHDLDPEAAQKITAGSINLEAAIRCFYAAFERLLEKP